MKRKRKNELSKDIAPASAPKKDSDADRAIADAVNDWITESRETRRAEKAFSDETISAWRLMSLSANFK